MTKAPSTKTRNHLQGDNDPDRRRGGGQHVQGHSFPLSMGYVWFVSDFDIIYQ
jgi:hypothetical protein